MKIRKRVIVLFLTALLVNGYALAGVKTPKLNAGPGCAECCGKWHSCCVSKCSWWNLFCIANCADSNTVCLDACYYYGQPCNMPSPEQCPES